MMSTMQKQQSSIQKIKHGNGSVLSSRFFPPCQALKSFILPKRGDAPTTVQSVEQWIVTDYQCATSKLQEAISTNHKCW